MTIEKIYNYFDSKINDNLEYFYEDEYTNLYNNIINDLELLKGDFSCWCDEISDGVYEVIIIHNGETGSIKIKSNYDASILADDLYRVIKEIS